MAVRLRVQLGFPPPGDAPARFWWQPPQGAATVEDLLQMLGTDLGLEPVQHRRLAATMDGFVVLGSSRTDLLRDGDTLLVSLGSKRGAAGNAAAGGDGAVQQPPAKRHKPAPQPAPAPESSSGEEDSSSSEEESSEEESSSEEEEEEANSSESEGSGQQPDVHTPAAPAHAADQATTGKRPSRSARRKAAKRRLRRMGMLPAGKGAAAAAAVQAAAPQAAAPVPAAATKQQPASAPRAEQPVQAAAKEPAVMARAPAPAGQQRQQQQCQQLPEVVVPAEWQPGTGKGRGQQQKQRGGKQQQARSQQQQQQSGFHAVPPPAAAIAAAPAATPAPQPAMSEAVFSRLQPLTGEPCVGDVLAYRLLEIGADLQPAVSEVRCGRVAEVAPPAITLAPHPDPGVHPLAYQRALRRNQRLAAAAAAGEGADAEDESEDEEPGSQYDEDGLLTAELASFVELRLVQPAAGKRGSRSAAKVAAHAQPSAAAAAAAGEPAGKAAAQPAAPPATVAAAAPTGGSADEGLGPSSYSQLGPPRPASRGDVIAAEGGWASLYEQLRQRRAQLAGQAAEAGQPAPAAAVAGTPKALAPQPSGSGAHAVHSAPPAAGRERSIEAASTGGGGRSLTPGATRPRAGVRRTALGPMLRMLRESQELS